MGCDENKKFNYLLCNLNRLEARNRSIFMIYIMNSWLHVELKNLGKISFFKWMGKITYKKSQEWVDETQNKTWVALKKSILDSLK